LSQFTNWLNREALAVPPAITEVRVLIIRGDRLGGGTALTALDAGRFDRKRLAQTALGQVNPLTVIENADGLIRDKGEAHTVAPLDLRAVVRPGRPRGGATLDQGGPAALRQPGVAEPVPLKSLLTKT
jgi:hypothetical protein